MRDDDSHEPAPRERLRVFLCHSSKDKSQVYDLYRRLRDEGFQPWLNEEDLLPGQDWKTEIQKAVRASHAVIVCLSHNSVSEPGFMQKEILYALEVAEEQPPGRLFILPVRLEECEIPQRLNAKHYANLFAEGGYARLVKSLRACARERGLFTPAPLPKPNKVKPVLPPAPTHIHPRPSPRPARPSVANLAGNRKERSIILPLSGAVLLVVVLAVIVGLWLGNSRGGKVVADTVDQPFVNSLVSNENPHPAPRTLDTPVPTPEKTPIPTTPEPTPVKTPERPNATPPPAEPQAEQVENKDDAPPPSTDDATQRTPKRSSSLSTYEVQIFLTRDTQNQMSFVEDLKLRLKPYVRLVKYRNDKPFSHDVTRCRVLYVDTGKDEPRNESAVARALLEQLNRLYTGANFNGKIVQDPNRKSENILTLVIGAGCKR